VLYIADEDNHCIRILYLNDMITKTVAGKCGEQGFKDGPTGINRFNSPNRIGINEQGIIFVQEIGNNYIRMI